MHLTFFTSQPLLRGWLVLFIRVFTIACFFLKTHHVYSQEHTSGTTKFGVAVGLNFTNTSLSQSTFPPGLIFKKSNKLSHTFGLRTNIPFSQIISLQTGINYHNFSYEITQKTFGTDSLFGSVKTRNYIQSFEIPLVLSFKLQSENKFIKHLFVAAGIGLGIDHYTRFVSDIHLTEVVPNPTGGLFQYSTQIYDGLSTSKNTFAPSLIAGIGTDIKIHKQNSFQLNLWYAQGLKHQAQYDITYIHQFKYIYPMTIKAKISSFRLEAVFFPWRL